jgi:hypothetical protein
LYFSKMKSAFRSIFLFLCTLLILVNITLAAPALSWRYQGSDWTDDDKATIRVAMKHLKSHINDSNIRQCIEKYTTRYRGNFDDRERQSWVDYDALARVSKWPTLNIIGVVTESSWRGLAYVERNLYGNAEDDSSRTASSLKTRKKPTISLNLRSLREYESNIGESEAAKQFSGVILHEVLHQMGHDHPSTGNYEDDYEAGHFVVVAGDCLHTSGLMARSPVAPEFSADGTSGENSSAPIGGWHRGE